MSNTERRLPLAVARQIALDLVELLRPACERIEIAGSIRRKKDDIGDVEIVCIPKVTTAETKIADLFGTPETVETNALDTLCQYMLEACVLRYRRNANGGKSWGSDLKWGIYQDFAVDIYAATPETWGVTLAIRTGCAEFSHKLVTPRSQGGFCPANLQFKGWRVRRRDDGMAYSTPEEGDVLHALGLRWIEPWARDEHASPMRLVAHA